MCSPYVYCGNNPVMLIDPDGREVDGVQDESPTEFEHEGAKYQSRSDGVYKMEPITEDWTRIPSPSKEMMVKAGLVA